MRLIKLIVSGILGILLIAIVYYVVSYFVKVNNFPKAIESPAIIRIPATKSITFFAFGDSGTGKLAQIELAKTMEQRCLLNQPTGILHLGDAIYPKGVKSVDDKKWDERIFKMYGDECLSDVPIYPVLGNHDYRGSIAAWYETAKRNPRWQYRNRHYTIEVEGLATLFAMDTNYPVYISKTLPQLDQPSDKWKIAFGHHPLRSQSTHRRGHKGKDLRAWRLRQLLCKNVDSYITGHSHHLEYGKYPDCAAEQYISGASGARLYDVVETPTVAFARSEYGFLEIQLSELEMTGRFISVSGRKLFEHTQKKNQ